jgi:hypothetical protein
VFVPFGGSRRSRVIQFVLTITSPGNLHCEGLALFETITAPFKILLAARRHRRMERLTAQGADLKDGQPYEPLISAQQKFCQGRGTGQSITRIRGGGLVCNDKPTKGRGLIRAL